MLLFISVGLKGMVTAIEEFFLYEKYQTCCVHLARNNGFKVRVSDRTEICVDIKSVYRVNDEWT